MQQVRDMDRNMPALGARVSYVTNALRPTDRRTFGAAVGATLQQLRPPGAPCVVCVLNGAPVPAAEWDLVPQFDDDVVFYCLPQGGGNGGGSNAISVVLSLVLIVAGAYTGNASLIAAGVGILAVGLLPVPSAVPIAAAPSSQQELSPTYSFQLQGNSARLGQAIPVVYGYHILTPDFAAQPYSEYDADGDQFYYALFSLGMATSMSLVNTYIDDTPLAHFQDVTTQLVGAAYGGTVTLVHPSVVNAPEVAQQDLLYGQIVGPFTASGPGTKCTKIGFDILCPKGLYLAEDDGSLSAKTIGWLVEARALTDNGSIAGAWFPLGFESITDAVSRPLRRTYTYSVPAGRYQVRAQRTTERDDNTRAGHDIQWLGMRAYLNTSVPLDANANYLAIKIRATSQLSGLSQRRFTCVVQRNLPTWNPLTGWSAPVATRSIAWALADILRNEVYGGQLPDDRIDLQTLYELDNLWSTRYDSFNGVFDKRVTVWSALETVARVGRTRPIMRGCVFTFVRDGAETLPTALFNMRNIQRGSFALDYTLWTENAPDGVELEYFDSSTWSSNYVTMPLPGAEEEPVNPAKISIVGITGVQQASREAAYYAASMVYRRAQVTFVTEMEGFLPCFGALIAISHDVAGWGVSGEILDWDGITAEISESPTWTSENHYAVLTDTMGDLHGPYLVAPGTDDSHMRFLEQPATGVVYVGREKERTRYAVGAASAYATLCKVTSITPQSETTVQIRAVIEDARVHTADVAYAGGSSGSGGGGGGGSSGPRVAHYAPDGLSNYNAASDAERSRYGYFTDEDRTVGTSNDEGYVYDS